VREALVEKCATKGVPMPTVAALESAATRADLETEWEHMLGHQLPALPPFASFWAEVPGLFAWLDGTVSVELAPMAADGNEDAGWSPPATSWTWGTAYPLESVRFAAANRLCVELGYHGSVRVIEPYSLRRSRDGYLLLHAIRADSRGHRSYRVDRITSIRVTTRPFRPVYRVEFSSSGQLAAPPARGAWRATTATRRSGSIYVIQCGHCERLFRRNTRSTVLRPHKDSDGERCYGRHGYLVDEIDG
jgi:hypothetical protein